jgi:peptidoglycan/xylan/chitin deacetylase (PgdA/CDA1 family)
MDPCQCPNVYWSNQFCPNGVFRPSGAGGGGNGGSSTRGRGVFTQCFNKNQIALTFDDGPFWSTNDLLGLLDRKGVVATFFVNGQNQGDLTQPRWADVVRSAANRGHCIASHTWSHRSLGNIDDGGIRREMLDLESLLVQILGKRVRYMRPPYGDLGGFSREWLLNQGYDIVMWNVDGWDWDQGKSLDQVWRDQVGGMYKGNGPIVLNHDIWPRTVYQLVEREIDYARSQGLQFVSMDQCLQMSCYR